MTTVGLEALADLKPGPEVSAFLAASPHLIAFLDAARNRLMELIHLPFDMDLRMGHGGESVVLIVRIDGTVEQARKLMDQFDDQWLLKLPCGCDDGVVVDILPGKP